MTATDNPPYRDASLPVERRVDDLLDRMTLEEKVAQLTAVPARYMALDESAAESAVHLLDEDGNINRDNARELIGDGVGHFTRLGGGGSLEPERAAEVTNELQEMVQEETRLGIPAVPHEECLSGYMGPDGTTYPQGIGLASTWNPDLVEEMTTRIREQLQAIGTVHALSPVLDVGRDPRWGRTEETFGEDEYLVAEMASAYVRGLQGEDPTEGISATVKHFAGHAVGEGAKNRSSVQIGERELREVHLFPFEAAIRETGAESVMNAYHDIDGVPCAKDRSLLTGILREEWGFDGTVVSDYFSVRYLDDEHGVAADHYEAGIQALEAGMDVELPQVAAYDKLVDAVENGDLAEETVDVAARRVLRQKVEKGVLDDPFVDVDSVSEEFGPDADRDYARKLGRESVTLLKNADDLLPLVGEEDVAVVGPKADTPEGQLGDYAYAAHYPERDANREVVTPLDALEERLGDQVTYAEGCTTTGPATEGFEDAVAAAEDSDVAVAFVGTRSAIAFSDPEADMVEQPDVPTSGEGADVTDLQLPGVQQELVEELHDTDTPLVVVQVTGKPHAIEWIDDNVPAILQAWLPGEEGGHGIADVLLGDHNPSGRLPLSVPKNVGQLPVYYSRKPNSRNENHVYTDEDPLYPFGHGLSYTEFEYGEVSLSETEVGPADTVTASVTVENTGDVAGHEVVQLYTHQDNPSLARPVQELRGFERVHLEPGESATVTVTLSTAQLAFHDTDMDLVVEPDTYEVRVGSSAADIESTATFDVVGERYEVPSSGRAYFSDSSVEE
ncbi:beta-glucosidase [Halomicrobium zhouii]|uniref:Beta-glucosidase n=2 Tax=Halomicrobium zhouii TaxID=767519 RepID=A0A1I6L4D9_9EURY|nr:beta-glucosidase [Halomicrobium zhouii]